MLSFTVVELDSTKDYPVVARNLKYPVVPSVGHEIIVNKCNFQQHEETLYKVEQVVWKTDVFGTSMNILVMVTKA